MSAIGDAVAAVLADLSTFGLAATADPGEVLPLVNERGYAVVVHPPTVERSRLSGARVLSMPVYIAIRPPGDPAAYEIAWEALEESMQALRVGDAERATLTVGDQALPAYLLTVDRITN